MTYEIQDILVKRVKNLETVILEATQEPTQPKEPVQNSKICPSIKTFQFPNEGVGGDHLYLLKFVVCY